MIFVAMFFVILGVLIKNGKMYFLLAGYNTMSEEEKAQYNIEGIATIFRNAMFGMAFIIVAGYFLALKLGNENIETVALFVAILAGLPYLLYKSNSEEYKIDN